MLRPSQEPYEHPDLEGLCESPHDDPPKWALMLTAYFDESLENGDGYAVMAGFFGTKDSWTRCAEEWKAALGKRSALHMKKLRWKGDRNKELLARLGPIPHNCGLHPVFASVRLRDYRENLKKPKSKISNGYFVTLIGVATATLAALPRGERIEFIFEQQLHYAEARDMALHVLSNQARYRGRRGKPTLAKYGSAPKSTLLEPADYLAYALLQTIVDPHSLRSRLCAPILKHGKRRIGGKMTEREVRRILTYKKPPPL